MGQIIGCLPGVKGKLHDFHTGITGVLQELTNLRRHKAKVLRNEVQIRQCFLHSPHKVHTGAFHPGTTRCGLVSCRYCPIAFKSPEVIQPNHIIHLRSSFQTTDPPCIICFLHPVPVIQGISPELAVSREGVRWAAGHHFRTAAAVQLEQMGICPDICRVQGHINRHIANNADAFPVCIAAKRFPLPGKLELQEIVETNGVIQVLAIAFQNTRKAHQQADGPILPAVTAGLFLQRHKQRIILQPIGIGCDKLVVRFIGFKPLKSTIEQLAAVIIQASVIYPGFFLTPADFLLLQETFRNEGIQIDQVGVARKGGKGLIRRISVTGRTQGQDLPIGLSCTAKKIHKIICAFSHAADAIGPGQR